MREKTIVIVVILLWISVVISIVINPKFGIQFIFGTISLLSASTALLLRKKDLCLGIVTFALFLSTFNAILFSEAFGASIGCISLIPFLLLLLLIFSNFAELIDLKEKWFSPEPIEVEKARENKIAFYKREFQNLSSEELIRRGNDEKIVEEAKIAIKQL